MWTLIKTAWMATSTFKNARHYILLVIVGVLAGGAVYAIYTSQARIIASQANSLQSSGEKLGAARQDNELLKQSLEAAQRGQADAEKKYVQLDAEHLANARKLEETERENNELRKHMRDAQQGDPGANGSIPIDVKRMHDEAVRAFNEKYRIGRAGTQASDSARADVRYAGSSVR